MDRSILFVVSTFFLQFYKAGGFMRRIYFFVGTLVSLSLAACSTAHLDPVMTKATNTYFVQSVTVTESDQFVAALGAPKGGTQQQTASNFGSDVQHGLATDLPSLMHGKSPAKISAVLTSYEVGDNSFSSRSLAVNGVVKIQDSASGAVVAQFDVQADNHDMKARQDSDPLAALGATLIMSAVSPKTDLRLRNLAGVFVREVKVALGGSSLF
jgi:hypothetical protein